MTIVVSVKVTDGIVLASDSATTFFDTAGVPVKVYNNANKVFNLIKGSPIGAMTYGAGSIGTASVATLSKDFRQQLTNVDSEYYVDHHGDYTLKDVATKAKSFFRKKWAEAYPDGVENFFMGYRVFGYSSAGTLPEGYEVQITGTEDLELMDLYPAGGFGPRWAGDNEAIDRLLFGHSQQLWQALRELGFDPAHEEALKAHLMTRLNVMLYLPAMPIQDAIDLARFLADTAAKYAHFRMQAATIGGPIEIATITKHEGFKWVARKHYFSRDLNETWNV